MKRTRCFVIPVSALLIASCSDGRNEEQERKYSSLNDTAQILQPAAEEPAPEVREPVDTQQLVGGKEPLHRFNPKCEIESVTSTSIMTDVEFTNALDESSAFYVDVDVFYGDEKVADMTVESDFVSVGEDEWEYGRKKDVSGIEKKRIRNFWNCEITALRPKS